MKSFRIDDRKEIICEWKKTRTAFKHEATLLVDGREVDKTKICYQNRTRESYEYESVIEKLLSKSNILTAEEKAEFLKQNKDGQYRQINDNFKTIGLVAKLGEVFGNTPKEKNDWKKRMLNAGLGNQGLSFPDDFDQLDEAEKERRLNGAIQELNK